MRALSEKVDSKCKKTGSFRFFAIHKTTHYIRKLVNKLPNLDDIKETVNKVVRENLAKSSTMNKQLKKLINEVVREIFIENSCRQR